MFQESSQQPVLPSEPPSSSVTPPVPSSEPVGTKAPSAVQTPTEWHRHVEPTAPVVQMSGPDSSASENSVLFRFISAQFTAIQSKIDSKFVI